MRDINRKIFYTYRKLQLSLFPEVIKLGKKRYIRVVRIANEGFNLKPYVTIDLDSYSYPHPGNFLDIKIQNLNQYTINIDQKDVIIPRVRENLMRGCHCFIYKFDLTQAQSEGNLSFRSDDKLNIGYLPEDEVVWVRNVDSKINTFIKTIEFTSPETYLVDIKRFGSEWCRKLIGLKCR